MSLADKFEYLIGTKKAIRDALNESGARIDESLPFRQYAGWIDWLNYSRANVLRSLFANGETGTLASDLPYFVDVDGNTPATWGDPVGLIRDASPNRADFTQPTVTARPILGRVPRGGRRNLLDNSEDFGAMPTTNLSVVDTGETKTFLLDGEIQTFKRWKLIPNTEIGAHLLRIETWPIDSISRRNYVIVEAGEYDTLTLTRKSSHHENNDQFSRFDLTGGTVDNTYSGTYGHIEEVITGIYKCSFISDSTNAVRNRFNVAVESEPLGPGYDKAAGDGTSGIYIYAAQGEFDLETTPYQHVTTQYDITESGVKPVHYLDFDLTDDNLTTTLPAIENGTVVIAGTNGIWIDDDYNFDGGSFSIGPTSYTNGPEGVLTVIGDPIERGFLVINRQLRQQERDLVIQEMKERGAPGVLRPGPELVVNGDFSDGLEGWILNPLSNGESTATLIDGGVRIDDPVGSNSNFFQPNVFAEPGAYLISWEVLDRSGGSYRLRGPTFPPSIPAGGKGAVAQYTSIGSVLIQNASAAGDSFLEFTNVSVRKLELIP